MGTESMESVRYFVRGLFRGMPENGRLVEQREELESHMRDRIADGMANGLSHDEAFSRAISALGNLDELIETMSGQKKKILGKRADWLMMAGGIAYGTLYMLAVGIWFALEGFGWTAVYVAIPGWLGFVLPALFKLIDYRKHPSATEVVPLDLSARVRASVIGWALISSVCWVVNALFMGTDQFLHVVWAWMPTFGLLTWPLMEAGYAWMVKNLKSIEPVDRDGQGDPN